MSKKCGVCERPKGDPHRYPVAGECTAPDSSDYTVSIQCLSIALRKAHNDVRAAEERGRRRAETEQADLLLECEEALVWCSAADAFSPDGIAVKGWQRIVVPVLERIRAVRKNLAPRDSGKVWDNAEFLEQHYESRGHSAEEARRMARGEPEPKDRK